MSDETYTFILGGDGNLTVDPPFPPGCDLSIIERIEWSIIKWETIVSHLKQGCVLYDGAYKTCALCAEFFCRVQCGECPVITLGDGGVACDNTPYQDWANAVGIRSGEDYDRELALAAAEAEVLFLQDLLETAKGDDGNS